MASKGFFEAVAETEIQFSIFENIADGVCVSSEGMTYYLNEYLAKRFGAGKGKPYQKLFPDLKINEGSLSEGIVTREQWHSAKTNQTFDVIHSPITNRDGRIWMLSLFVNVTEKSRLNKRIERYYTKLKETNRELKLVNKTLSAANQKLEELSIKDELTGLYNHRHFWDILSIEFKRAARYGSPISCLMIDIDLFKSVNDLGGHAFGDYCLGEVGRMVRSYLRATDMAARYGGEEFAVILPSTNYVGARIISEKIRKKIQKKPFVRGETIMNLTVSIGVSSMPEDKIDRYSRLVEYADHALYEAKMQGRNRVFLYHDISKKRRESRVGREKIEEIGQKLLHIMEGVKRDYIEATKNLVQSIEFKDKYRQNHSVRVSLYAARIAEALNISQDQIDSITFAALLHDLGLMVMSPDILNKAGSLEKEEYEIVKEHPGLGARMLENIKHLQEEYHAILYHHEWFDGTGYPHGLKGEEIPLGARILSVADAYDAMRSQRPHRPPLSREEIEKEFKRFSGKQFDSDLVSLMLRLTRDDSLIGTK